jgi:hypothetical protein
LVKPDAQRDAITKRSVYPSRTYEHFLADDGPVDEAMIRRWAFDPDSELAEQDEDLLLHEWALPRFCWN